jgi:hypothetical protein
VTGERWEGDERGAGVSDGEAFAPPLRALLNEMARPDWNTEQPEAHLLPHLERWLRAEDAPLTLVDVRDEDGILELDLDARGAHRWDVRTLVYALVATIAEPTTVIVERDEDHVAVVEVTLAVAPWQSRPFPKGHGHLVRLRVLGTTGADQAGRGAGA